MSFLGTQYSFSHFFLAIMMKIITMLQFIQIFF
jgi:hypothetical protein